ncbi:MAG: ribonuclease HI [Gemmatimonadota bacterium]|nr:MAG: ribonuclease HI [Gemmatimonadota bacterium]
MFDKTIDRAVIHADESCLGNGMEGTNPGGAASLVEILRAEEISRYDLYISAPDTTNNRMALSGAIATIALVTERCGRVPLIFVSDSQYLVKGISQWAPGWRARGWRRKGGRVENLEMWKRLVVVSSKQQVTWIWVPGHAGHAKNEYANDLAIRAATEQSISEGLIESGFDEWLLSRRSRGLFADYDPDRNTRELGAALEQKQ